jgi:hypothetical protein
MKGKIVTDNQVALYLAEGKHLESGLWMTPSAGGVACTRRKWVNSTQKDTNRN